MEENGNSNINETVNSENALKILVATDNHLGYEETDPIIGNDSFVTFEEILQLAEEHDVDMILLGGDLFHHNNPSQQTFNKCMSLLRKYTMGNKEIYLRLQAHQAIESTVEGAPPVNYMDSNLNVAIPVFSIHGNHDDPSSVGLCSSLDTLSSAGLVNYFGKKTNLDNIEIYPILLQKGSTRLALYGLSHIKDERLSRLFLQEKVNLVRPKEFTDEWFNLFVLHQNRVDRGPKRFISDSYLPGFLDLIIWGHEHDCDIVPQQNMDKGFFVSQPGSSVPTSLSEGETIPKHVALLTIDGRRFKLDALKLKTTRPFLFQSIKLKDIRVSSVDRQKKSEEIAAFCEEKVEEMINEAKSLLTGHPKQPALPLIRLRCEYNDETQLFNVVKFGQLFYKRVANPDTEVIRLKKIAAVRDRTAERDAKDDLNRLKEINEELENEPETFSACVESIVDEYFKTFADKKMLVLSVKGMSEAVKQVIEKGDSSAIDTVCQHQRDVTLKKMMALGNITEANVMEQLHFLRDERENNGRNDDEQDNQLHQLFESRGSSTRSMAAVGPEEVSLLSEGEDYGEETRPRRGGRTAATRTLRHPFSDEEMEPEPAPARGRGRGRGSRGGRASGAPRARAAARAPRGARAKAAAPPPSITSFFPATPTRSTPVRAAARSSQANISAIAYDDDDSDF